MIKIIIITYHCPVCDEYSGDVMYPTGEMVNNSDMYPWLNEVCKCSNCEWIGTFADMNQM